MTWRAVVRRTGSLIGSSVEGALLAAGFVLFMILIGASAAIVTVVVIVGVRLLMG